MIKQRKDDDILFEVETPLGFTVRTTIRYWDVIAEIKHPAIRGREDEIQTALQCPDEIRLSKNDLQLYLFYRATDAKRWICAVVKRFNGEEFLVTAYRTDRIKEGKRIWPM